MPAQHETTVPELEAVAWLNTTRPLNLAELKGKVVVIHAFQMLCPGCVTHGIPQATAVHSLFPQDEVQVIGLHTVFEHHEVMTVEALTAFAHEYRIPFPVAVDTPSGKAGIPITMARYQMQGTPTLIIIDQSGKVRLQHFGRMSDMQVGSIIGSLLQEADSSETGVKDSTAAEVADSSGCDESGCAI